MATGILLILIGAWIIGHVTIGGLGAKLASGVGR